MQLNVLEGMREGLSFPQGEEVVCTEHGFQYAAAAAISKKVVVVVVVVRK